MRHNYYLVGNRIFVFNLSSKKLWIYTFNPFNKRVKFRYPGVGRPSILLVFHRFHILGATNFGSDNPMSYFKVVGITKVKYLRDGDYLL